MDFYTIKTSIDIVNDATAFQHVLTAIGFFAQPLIVGQPVEEDGSFMFRFSVRTTTVAPYEDAVVANIAHLDDFGFTVENTELVRAARI